MSQTAQPPFPNSAQPEKVSYQLMNHFIAPAALEREMLRIAQEETTILERQITVQGMTCKTYDASVASEHFAKYWCTRDLKMAVRLYTGFLQQRIAGLKAQDPGQAYYTMSDSHIYSEMMTHLYGWFIARIRNAKITDLNVTESRWYVLLVMKLFGYRGKEDLDIPEAAPGGESE